MKKGLTCRYVLKMQVSNFCRVLVYDLFRRLPAAYMPKPT